MQQTCQEVKALSPKYYSSFKAVYEDFCKCAFTEYKFELEPLDYDSFIESCENELLTVLFIQKTIFRKRFLFTRLQSPNPSNSTSFTAEILKTLHKEVLR